MVKVGEEGGEGMVDAKFLGIILGFIVAVIGLNMGLFFIGVSLNQVGEGGGILFSEKGWLYDIFHVGVEVGDGGGNGGGNGGGGNGGGGSGGGSGGGGSSSSKRGCKENWKCGEWTNCIDGEQTRECVDLNNCGTVGHKPEEKVGCESPLVASCKDGLKNQGEEDVDCGGPCPPCFEKPLNLEYLKYGGYGVIGGGVIFFLIAYFRRREEKKVLNKYRKKWKTVLRRGFG